MRLQTVVQCELGGYTTCEKCRRYLPCATIQIKGESGAESAATLCLPCLTNSNFTLDSVRTVNYTAKERIRTNKKAKKSEAKTASETGGRQTGYFPSAGDSRNSRFLFEDKTKISGDRQSYRLAETTVLKGRDQARRAGLIPVFRVHLKNVSIGVMLWDDLLPLVSDKDEDAGS